MRIAEIQWENYRRLQDSSLEVRNHLVLVGPNDSGKSSILRILYLCLAATQGQLMQGIGIRDYTDPTKPLVMSVKLEDLENIEEAFPDEITVGEPNTLTIRIEAAVESSDSESQDVRRYFPQSGHVKAPSRSQLDAIGFRYVSAARSLSRELAGSRGSAIRELISEVDLADDIAEIKKSIASVQVALDEAGSLQTFRGELAEALTDALPKSVTQSDVRFLTEPGFSDDPMSGVTLTINDSGYDTPLKEQSDGIQAMSAMALMGLSFKGSDVIAIDEPEVHLHPVAQRSMARQLRKLRGQRIIATHSPSVVGAFPPNNIAVMRSNRSIRQLQADAEINQDAVAVRHWANRLIEPLTARRVVLVEGPSDQIMFERVAELLGVRLDREGVAVFELGGAGLFPTAYGVYGPSGFDVPLTGMVDEAERDDWAKVIKVAGNELENSGYVVCKPDLEGEYINALGHEFVLDVLAQTMKSSMLRSFGVQSVTEISPNQLLSFCKHRKRKVVSALAISQALDEGMAMKLQSLGKLVEYACS